MVTDVERDVLLGRLRGVRQHVLAQLEGLDDEQLRRPVLPSGWNCLGLVRHLTLSDERYWFEVVMGGGPLDFWPEGHNADWLVGEDEPAEAVIDDYRSAAAASDALIERLPSARHRYSPRTRGPRPGSPSLTCAPSWRTCWSRPPLMPGTWTPPAN